VVVQMQVAAPSEAIGFAVAAAVVAVVVVGL
jgi:hypothetical protein